MKDMLLSLADELEGMDVREGCRTCPADGTKDCRGDLSCEEAVARAVARRVREIVEHDECEVTTMSAYDLLPEDEREAIAWVRKHGGLDEVEKRLMPEGMEWPRFEDGEPVRLGEHWEEDGFDESVTRIDSIEFADDGVRFENEYNEVFCRYGERVKRPPVLAADGEPLEAGQTVYAKNYGYVKCTVLAIEWVVDGYLVEVENEGGHKFRQTPDEFTHRAPVLAADGRPLKKGETVYSDSLGEGPFTVREIKPDDDPDEPEHLVWCGETWGESLNYAKKWRIPDQLTHERPDSWERLEHDAEKTVCEYFGANYDCANCPLESARCAEEVKKDIIRRARKLAERDA